MFATKFSRGAVTSALVIRLSHLLTPCKVNLSDVKALRYYPSLKGLIDFVFLIMTLMSFQIYSDKHTKYAILSGY